ncbi:MAG: ABC transporter substrate-binding protein [Halolamina sp.]
MVDIDQSDLEGPKIDRRTTMKLLGAAGVSASASALAGCTGGSGGEGGDGTAGEGAKQTGGSVTVGWMIDNIEFLDPHMVGLGEQIEIHSNIFNGLVKLNENIEIVGDAAKDWSLPDDTTYVFQLREGITFHNGDTLDAEAVKWSLERLAGDESLEHHAKMANVESVEATGEYEVTVNLSKPTAPFISFMLRGPGRAGTIVHKSAADDPDAYNREPVGSGPFKLTGRTSGESLTLEAYDDYWETDEDGNQLPYLDKIEIKLIPEPSTLWSAVESGEVAYANIMTGEFAQQAEGRNDLNVAASSAGDWACVAPLTTNPQEVPEQAKYASGYDEVTDKWEGEDLPTTDPKVRKALSLAIDREEIVEKAWFGYAETAHALYNPAIGWLYDHLGGDEPDPGQYQDVERAKQLLDEAGYTGDPRLEFSVLALPEDEREMTVIQEQWREIGVETSLDIQQESSYWDNIYRYEHTVTTYGGAADVDPWMSDFKQLGTPDPETGMGAWQKNLWSNEKFDEAILEATRTPDLDKRAKIYEDAHEAFIEDAPYAMTTFPLNPKVSTAEFNGVGIQVGLSNFHRAHLSE